MSSRLLTGNEAVALAARDAMIALGTGYPGTPSTEILENFGALGGRAQWAPNEKVALEVALGAAYACGRVLVTMKHVGVNVAADPLFTAAYTGVTGALVIAAADDPGMHSSQNEQDTRRYAEAAGVPMLEPADSQEAYDYMLAATELSERFGTPVLLRMTTRVCHSKTPVTPRGAPLPAPPPGYERDIPRRVMIPAYARPAHRKLREKLSRLADWSEESDLHRVIPGTGDGKALGVITSGVATMHVAEAAPEASMFKLAMTYPLPLKRLAEFARSVERCVAVEEGDPYLANALRAADAPVEAPIEEFRFGELSVSRVQRLLAGETAPEPPPEPGKPPRLCPNCPHRNVFGALSRIGCIVSGDIGCYTLGVLPPFEAMDTCACMGASIGAGLGMRHVLPRQQAKRVVSVIGDSTFVHSGVTGLIDMAYNPPPTGHVVIILDNEVTAMTGLQEHPGTGRRLDHGPAANKINYEALAWALGIQDVHTVDPLENEAGFEQLVRDCLENEGLSLIVARRPCPLSVNRLARMAAECGAPES